MHFTVEMRFMFNIYISFFQAGGETDVIEIDFSEAIVIPYFSWGKLEWRHNKSQFLFCWNENVLINYNIMWDNSCVRSENKAIFPTA